MEIKNRLTVTREEEETMGERKGRVIREHVKDPWTKPEGVGLREGGGGGWGRGEWWGRKWR